VSYFNKQIPGVYRSIADQTDQVVVEYNSSLPNETTYLSRLESNTARDRLLGQTTFGPHRDDVIFSFNSDLAIDTASRGEVRTIVLALKFIEAKLVQAETDEQPLILLDDIFSELDDTRQLHLVNNFQNHQVVITSVNPPNGLGDKVKLD
jgi:DNA replication and repair protein RecF